jgi:lipoprotein-releasing system permease protein
VVSIRELEPNIFDWLLMQSSTEVIILTIMFIVAILNLATALLILILERTNMIGILKSLGASNHFIRMIFMRQGANLIIKGLIIGNIIGIGLCYIQEKFQLIKLPPESYYVSIAPVDIDLIWILGLNIITFITCVFSLLIPSILISKITPIKSIRFK